MRRFSAFETLSGVVPAELSRVAEQLNRTGFATDEDGLFLGSTLIEHWSSKCTDLLREHGYDGGELSVSGGFFSGIGAIYILYDTAFRTGEEAAQVLRRVAISEQTA